MIASPRMSPRFAAVRPLVRYVDDGQAIIDTHIRLKSPMPGDAARDDCSRVDVRVEIDGDDGFRDEQQQALRLEQHQGVIRLEVVHPQRWWPAGMGEQAMYRLTVSLLVNDVVVDARAHSIGLTSVRRSVGGRASELLVNGRRYTASEIMPIDASDENALLPVGGESLLIVRDHYGPDVLYQAADRAGILLIQCVPIDPRGLPELGVPDEVIRLVSHPSLVGWCVGHLGALREPIARHLQQLDPTHSVFTDVPAEWAA